MTPAQRVGEIAATVVQINSGTWPDPEPLIAADSKPAEFPMAALGSMEAAARDIQLHVKCPAALAAASVLSAASLAAQGSHDVQFRGQDKRPLSLFILTIGRSGERKSTADQLAMIGVRRRIKELRIKADHDRKVNELSDCEPFPILSPEILATNGTVEGLTQSFLEGHPSQALMSDEAGQFLGGHSLKAENRLHGLATLSKFWDASPVTKKNRGVGQASDTRTLQDCRLAVHMLGQRVAISPFLIDPVARGQGSLARFLVHEPTTTMGTRLMSLEEWQRDAITENIMLFADRIEEVLRQASSRNRDGDVERSLLRMVPGAVTKIVAYFNSIETKLAPAGDLAGYADLANKIHENAVRISGVIAVMNGEPHITAQTMDAGIQLADYFLHELVRLSNLMPASQDIEKAKKIAEWLYKQGGKATERDLSRRGPKSCRNKEMRTEALTLLTEASWLRKSNSQLILNPKLGDRGETGDKPTTSLNNNYFSVSPASATEGATSSSITASPARLPQAGDDISS